MALFTLLIRKATWNSGLGYFNHPQPQLTGLWEYLWNCRKQEWKFWCFVKRSIHKISFLAHFNREFQVATK